jgi:hypothetical protein
VFVRKLPTIALTGVALSLAGTAIAGHRNNHIMDVALPDGSVARVEYAGKVAPVVTIEPARAPAMDDDWLPMPSFAGFDRMMADMNRRTEAMVRQAQQMARQPAGVPGSPIVASFGNAPAGATSTTVISYSNGSSTCTRTTETVLEGPGKAPKVTSNVSGDCGTSAAPAPQRSGAPINRT